MSFQSKLIFENLHKHVSLTYEEKNIVLEHLKENEVKKKDVLLRQGQSCKTIYFLEEGSMRAFNLNEDGKESTIMFAIHDWWVTDMDAFVNQGYSCLTILALEDCRLLELDYNSLQFLFDKVPSLERYFRILFQNAYIREQRRALYNISMSTEERYFAFIEKYPDIVEKITQKQIASYLGVSPEFLSTVKRKRES